MCVATLGRFCKQIHAHVCMTLQAVGNTKAWLYVQLLPRSGSVHTDASQLLLMHLMPYGRLIAGQQTHAAAQ